MQIKIIKYLSFIYIFILSACGITEPFVDSRREAGATYMVGESNADTVAICYNSLSTELLQIKDMAEKECQKTNRVAVFKEQKKFSCRFFVPTRVYFKCVKTKEEEEKEQTESKNHEEKFETISDIDFIEQKTDEDAFNSDPVNLNRREKENENSAF